MLKKNLFATLADKNSLDQVKTLLTSVLLNGCLPSNTDIIVLTNNTIPAHEEKWFKERNISFKNVEVQVKNRIFLDIYQSVFFLFSKEAKIKWDQVVFLESDIIVTGSLQYLFTVTHFSAVEDIFDLKNQFLTIKEIKNNKINGNSLRIESKLTTDLISKIQKLHSDYDLKTRSFNAGAFAFSTTAIPDNANELFSNLLKQYIAISRFGMQGIFNLFFYKNWAKLDNNYNALINLIDDITFAEKKKKTVIHFAGAAKNQKPWNNKSHQFYPIWKDYQEKSKLPYSQFFNYRTTTETKNKLVIWLESHKYYIYESKISLGKLKIKIKTLFFRHITQPAILIKLLFHKNSQTKKEKPKYGVYYQSSSSDLFVTVASILSAKTYFKEAEFIINFDKTSFLTRYVISLLQKIVDVRLISTNELNSINNKLRKYPTLHSFFNYGWSGKKCFLALINSKYEKTILLDSDTLFFDRPKTIIHWLNTKNTQSLFLRDYMSFQSISSVEMESLLGKKPNFSDINSGLLCFNTKQIWKKISLQELDTFANDCLALVKQRSRVDYLATNSIKSVFPLLEQTLHWYIFEKINSSPLPIKNYQVLPQHILYGYPIEDSVFIHFTGDNLRYHFFRQLHHLYFDKKDKNNTLSQRCFKCDHPKIPFWYYEV